MRALHYIEKAENRFPPSLPGDDYDYDDDNDDDNNDDFS